MAVRQGESALRTDSHARWCAKGPRAGMTSSLKQQRHGCPGVSWVLASSPRRQELALSSRIPRTAVCRCTRPALGAAHCGQWMNSNELMGWSWDVMNKDGWPDDVRRG